MGPDGPEERDRPERPARPAPSCPPTLPALPALHLVSAYSASTTSPSLTFDPDGDSDGFASEPGAPCACLYNCSATACDACCSCSVAFLIAARSSVCAAR